MPKDEFDFEDPFELNGIGLVTTEDTTDAMCECFIEEFMRLGHNHRQILSLFRNKHYIGMNMVLEKRGEEFVKTKIVEVFACWGRKVEWPVASNTETAKAEKLDGEAAPNSTSHFTQVDSSECDPTGAPIPKFTL